MNDSADALEHIATRVCHGAMRPIMRRTKSVNQRGGACLKTRTTFTAIASYDCPGGDPSRLAILTQENA